MYRIKLALFVYGSLSLFVYGRIQRMSYGREFLGLDSEPRREMSYLDAVHELQKQKVAHPHTMADWIFNEAIERQIAKAQILAENEMVFGVVPYVRQWLQSSSARIPSTASPV